MIVTTVFGRDVKSPAKAKNRVTAIEIHESRHACILETSVTLKNQTSCVALWRVEKDSQDF